MKAIVLMGGLGTRLRPITYGTPKSLLPIVNVTFLRRSFTWFASHGIREFVMALSNQASAIIEDVKALQPVIGFDVEFRVESVPMGSGGALRNCADLIDETAILYNGDILTDLDIGALIAFHKSRGASITASFNEVDDPTHYGVPELGPDGRVLDWQEKPSRAEAKSNYGNVGVWLIEPQIIAALPPDRPVSLETEVFPQLLRGGTPFFGYTFEGYWKDIGTIGKYLDANRDLLLGRIRGHEIDEPRTGESLWIGEGARVSPTSELVGPVVIGPGTTVGDGARIVGPTVVGAHCVIGDGASISESVLWSRARIGEGARIEGAVIGAAEIGADAVIGAGSVVSSDSRVAAGSYLAPSSLLGPGSSVAIGRS